MELGNNQFGQVRSIRLICRKIKYFQRKHMKVGCAYSRHVPGSRRK
ncbi:unnamed protein product [Acanthoscelides obtectus]|uniref:Uncharacterized protein n=1 Tax=Acanthoscelides obtectus TaxID=200917 RepID=A0A9P0P0J3_ACAOB|nr:unnamed protein product [Acanthoscelides obtectus]CAK1621908.1 hypothetical protein AOBTE_LOCUS1211 [Acanthoscelides obtectus]